MRHRVWVRKTALWVHSKQTGGGDLGGSTGWGSMSEEKRRRLASGAHTPCSEVVPGCRGLGPRSSSKLLHANRLRKSHLGAEGGADTFGGKKR